MSKKYIPLILFFLLFLGGLKFFDPLKQYLFYITKSIKTTYLDTISYFEDLINLHLNQKETIKKLLKENQNLKEHYLKYKAINDELESLKKECNITTKSSLNLQLIRAISYTTLGDFSSMWVDFSDFNQSKIYGLIKNGFAAGIVTQKDQKPIALLNSNFKCAYAVEIGQTRAPGIAIGKKDGTMVVKFIPMYKNIKIADEVVTSGMDNIFFYGIKVGRVVKIKTVGGYKNAVIMPYANLSNPRYFWIVKRVK